MKKTTTLILGFFLSFALTAQINPIKISKQLDKAEKNKVIRSGDEALSNLMVNPNPYTFYSGNSKNTTEVDIGWTSYDLQTNNSVQNRILDTMEIWLPFVEIRDIRIVNDDSRTDANQIVVNILFNIKQDPNTVDSVSIDFNSAIEDSTEIQGGGGY